MLRFYSVLLTFPLLSLSAGYSFSQDYADPGQCLWKWTGGDRNTSGPLATHSDALEACKSGNTGVQTVTNGGSCEYSGLSCRRYGTSRGQIGRIDNPCIEPALWDNDAQECSTPPEPPETPATCTDGSGTNWYAVPYSEADVVTWQGDSSIESFCNPRWDDQPCQNPIGEFNGRLLCADEQLECEAKGGTYGLVSVGEGNYNTDAVCIPPEYDDQLPTCDINSVQIIDIDDQGNGGFACASPDPFEPEDIPGSNDPNEPNPYVPDQDGDGIPDSQDPDIDGDGIPNAQDPDQDGDGIDDPNDPSPQGDEPESSVSGGGDCKSLPNCKGDAIQCALLYQSWRTRCDALVDSAAAQEFINSNSPDQVLGNSESLTSIAGDYLSVIPVTGTCPSPYPLSLNNASGVSVSFQPLCDFAGYLQPLVIAIFSMFGFRIVMRAF